MDKSKDRRIYCSTIYNATANTIMLLQFNESNLYNAMEFINSTRRIYGLEILISQYSLIDIQESDVQKPKSIQPAEYKETKYYMVIGGSPYNYKKIYEYVDLSNPFLEVIQKEILTHMSSTDFKNLIEAGILDEDWFTYKNREAKSEQLIDINTIYAHRNCKIMYDNIKTIMDKLPNVFTSLDVAKLIHIYDEYRTDIYNPIELADRLESTIHHNDDYDAGEYMYYKTIITNLSSLYEAIAPGIVDVNNLETLTYLTAPSYMRTEEMEDNDVFKTAELDPNKLDEAFHQEYDKFNSPLVDNNIIYKNIDEEHR